MKQKHIIEDMDMEMLSETEKCNGKYARVNATNEIEKSITDYIHVLINYIFIYY